MGALSDIAAALLVTPHLLLLRTILIKLRR